MKLIFLKRISVSLAVTAFAVAVQAAQVVPVIEVSQSDSAAGNYAISQNSQLMFTIQQLQDEVRQLRGQLESQEYIIKRMEGDQKERYRDLDRRISLMMQSQMQGGVAGFDNADAANDSVIREAPIDKLSVETKPEEQLIPQENVTSSKNPTQPAAETMAKTADLSSDADQNDYQAAFSLVRQRDFAGAENSFTRFLSDYPDSPRVPNAFYWLGEIYLAQGKHNESESAFLKVADQYSDSRKAADALYKLGILYKQQGDLEKSKLFMSRVVKEYPETSASQLAVSALGQ